MRRMRVEDKNIDAVAGKGNVWYQAASIIIKTGTKQQERENTKILNHAQSHMGISLIPVEIITLILNTKPQKENIPK